ncbi:MAG: hypothetical protein KDI71_03720 [Xanthomonadales bacterium]|nr:hypothetical protein [Xanthomonadales bacterium]
MIAALALVTSLQASESKSDDVGIIEIAINYSGLTNPVRVEMFVRNRSRTAVSVLRWNLPERRLTKRLFQVSRNGNAVSYNGVLGKRLPPTSSDYIAIGPGDELEFIVDLERDYDLSQAGEYEVKYNTEFLSHSIQGGTPEKSLPRVQADSVRFSLLPRDVSSKAPDITNPPEGGDTTFDSCSATQQNILLVSRQQAIAYSGGGKHYFDTQLMGSRYQSWFGDSTPARYSLAASKMSAIDAAMNSAGVQFLCRSAADPECDGVIAYVYGNQAYGIYICPIFWSISPLATFTSCASQAGTIIHEMSHFNVVAGTDDHEYCKSASLALADSNPSLAINNADSWEFFAENTPFQGGFGPLSPSFLTLTMETPIRGSSLFVDGFE